MKILHIPTGGLFSDGIGTFIYSYLESMDLSDWDVSIIATNKASNKDKEKFERLDVSIIPLERKKTRIIRYAINLYKLLRENQYDIVHVHGSSALMSIELLVAKLAGIQVRISHSHNTTCDHKKIDKILRSIFYRLYTDAWACGQEAGEWLFGNRTFTIIHNARDIKKYQFSKEKRINFREAYSIPENTLAIGHVGRFNVQKNQKFILSILEKMSTESRDVKVFLVGEGELLAEIKKLVIEKSLIDKVEFLGNQNDMSSFLSGMDVMILPSLYEGLPLVAIEWQINGVDSLLSSTITDECIFSNTVKKIPNDNVEKWVQAIQTIDINDRSNISLENIKLAKNNGYDIYSEAKRLSSLYKDSVRKKFEI